MPKPVILSVNVDLTPALVALRAFEIRVARVTSFGLTGRPSFVVGSAAFLAPSIGSSTVAKGDAVSQIQFTVPSPADQTIRALGMLGAVDVVAGSRVAGINKRLDIPSGATIYGQDMSRAAARGLNVGALRAMNQRFLGLHMAEAMALSVQGGGLPPTVPPIPASAPVRPPGPPLAPAAAATVARSRPKSGRQKGFAGVSARRGAEALRLGRGLRLTTAAGAIIAAIAVAEDFTEERSNLLREAAESGDPSSFSYEDIVAATTENFVTGLRDVVLGAASLSVKIGLTVGEAASNIGLFALTLVGEREEFEARAVSGEISRAAESAVADLANVFDTWSGKKAEQYKALLLKQDAWDRALGANHDKSNAETDIKARALSHQALSLGFMLGPGKDIEQQIAHELRQVKQNVDELEFRKGAKPRPTQHDLSGIKD